MGTLRAAEGQTWTFTSIKDNHFIQDLDGLLRIAISANSLLLVITISARTSSSEKIGLKTDSSQVLGRGEN